MSNGEGDEFPPLGRQLELIPSCVTQGCQATPIFRFTWPGKPESPACGPCAARAQNIARHMGFTLEVRALTTEGFPF
jgi:hypothetical protein